MQRFAGRDAMRAYWVQTGNVTSFAHHYITNHVVDVDPGGTTATGRCYLLGMSTREGQAYWMAVRYAEHSRQRCLAQGHRRSCLDSARPRGGELGIRA